MNIDFDLIEHLKEKILEIYNDSKEIKDIDVNKKDGNDIVTTVDLYMEKRIIETIKNIFPEHSIYSEECGEEKNKSEYEWFIDPIDGTINFASKIPLFSTSIALTSSVLLSSFTAMGLTKYWILVNSDNRISLLSSSASCGRCSSDCGSCSSDNNLAVTFSSFPKLSENGTNNKTVPFCCLTFSSFESPS